MSARPRLSSRVLPKAPGSFCLSLPEPPALPLTSLGLGPADGPHPGWLHHCIVPCLPLKWGLVLLVQSSELGA